MQLELAFSNPLGTVGSLEATYAVLDGSGVRFYTGSGSFDLVSEGERFRIQEDSVEPVPSDVDPAGISCQILDIGEGFSFGDSRAPADPTSCEFVELDSFGDIQILLSVTSPYSETENLRVAYGLYGPDQTRFADSSVRIDLVGGGETVRASEDTVTDPPQWLGDGQITCAVLGVESADF